ncbi:MULTISPECIES: integrase [Pseudomonas]|uniref:integrase n=1 Tax=Pseudomonas TaxID=286 RepID=UPI0035251706
MVKPLALSGRKGAIAALHDHGYRHAYLFAILGLISHRLSEPIAALSETKLTEPVQLPSAKPLVLAELDDSTRAAAEAFITTGTAANTARSYQSALTSWSAWLRLRYRRSLGDGALPPEVAVQFIVDHLARPDNSGGWTHLLPPAVDAALVAANIKGNQGPLSFSTVSHRLAVLAKWHRLRRWDNPSEVPAVKTPLREARKAQARQGVSVRKKTAVVLEPLQAMLATCTDGVRGTRDRALLLLAWGGGGRRRSEIVALQIGDLRRLDADTWLYAKPAAAACGGKAAGRTGGPGVERLARCSTDLRGPAVSPLVQRGPRRGCWAVR